MPDPVSLTISTYDKIGSQYASHSISSPQPEHQKFSQYLDRQSRVLDVGCGPAHHAALLSKLGFQVLGIDLSKGLLKQAHRFHPEVKTRFMDMRRLEFPNQSFDAIWAHASLLHLEKKDVPPTLHEFYRVLKPGGICHVMVKQGSGSEFVTEDRSAGKARFFSYFQQEELENYFENAGFNILESYVFNGKKRGTGSRDINWIVVFVQKN